MTEPFVRESGNGPTVVCLHASASSSAQWRALTERLSGRFRVLAVDLHGCGRTPGWPGPRSLQLDDETTMLDPVWERAGARFHLMGHSYGGAVAMHAAIRHVERIASLLVYEPVMFGLLNELEPDTMAASEINGVRADTSRFVASGHLDAAAARFGAYWLGDEAWAALTPERQAAVACAMPSVMPQWQAAFAEPPTRIEFGALSMPIQLLGGVCSTAAARAVSRLLADMLPHVFREELPGCGHMAPVTSPERVNPAIERFLATH